MKTLYNERRELFINWFGWSLLLEDCDSAIYMTKYMFNRFEFNREQRYWLAWLYGTTYHFPTAYVIWNEFPDMELVGQDRLKKWTDENYKRLRYQTDTRWNKGKLPEQFESYKQWVGDRTQKEAFAEHLTDDPHENFRVLWKEAHSWYKFGRVFTWFYLQTLKQCVGVQLDAPDLMLRDQSGSRSHRNGLCLALGKDDWVDAKLSEKDFEWLDEEAERLLGEVKLKFPATHTSADYFSMETVCCSFKKLFRRSRGRYLGYYLDRQAEEIALVEGDGWAGIDWNPLWQAREETLRPEYLVDQIDKRKMNIFLDSNVIDHMGTFSNEDQEIGLNKFFT